MRSVSLGGTSRSTSSVAPGPHDIRRRRSMPAASAGRPGPSRPASSGDRQLHPRPACAGAGAHLEARRAGIRRRTGVQVPRERQQDARRDRRAPTRASTSTRHDVVRSARRPEGQQAGLEEAAFVADRRASPAQQRYGLPKEPDQRVEHAVGGRGIALVEPLDRGQHRQDEFGLDLRVAARSGGLRQGGVRCAGARARWRGPRRCRASPAGFRRGAWCRPSPRIPASRTRRGIGPAVPCRSRRPFR